MAEGGGAQSRFSPQVRRSIRVTWELFQNLVKRDLHGKYKRTSLGQLWSLANPLALMLVYTFVFAFIIRVQVQPGKPSGLSNFPLWLLSGLIPWIFFSTVLVQGINSIISNEALIKKVYFPRKLLLFSTIASVASNWLIETGVLVVAILIAGGVGIIWFLPVLLAVMAVFVLFCTGVALWLSIINVYFRDLEYLVGVALQLGLYLTPVLYPLSLVQEQTSKISGPTGEIAFKLYELNPMVGFISMFRNICYDNTFPDLQTVAFTVTATIIVFASGWWFFSNKEDKLAELI